MNYKTQADKQTVIDGITLTNAYGDARSGLINIRYKQAVTLYVRYTMGSAETSNSIQLKVEFSPERTVYYRESTEAISSGTRTLSLAEYTFSATQSAGTYDNFIIEYGPEKHRFINSHTMKVSVKETGIAANGGTCYVYAAVAGE